ncbi:hypothetical protein HYPSUDRAFT_83902 [Hypholoma sublateritium FD-334 SS-4]|uniref:Uncharacterized protein n=1 Tax=Hypholoma sublateritium (strain FD-334 SS-4) TaxID=945553 RepID=A0A0D2MSL0_HYPSF|nr:hypothetical protein HYPSUDRAFT_83902 [Hypholoma sublateritium FD-334 SS-4]
MADRVISLPTHLDRPGPVDVRPGTLGSAYGGLPPSKVREHLRKLRPQYSAGLHCAQLSIDPQAAIPSKMVVPINSFISDLTIYPTHILVIGPEVTEPERPDPSAPASTDTSTDTSDPAQGRRRRLEVFPVHDIVLAANCPNVPDLKAGVVLPVARKPETLTIPVVCALMPSVFTFHFVHAFLYSGDTAALRAALLPPGWKADGATGAVKRAIIVHGVWANARKLGVVDERIGERNESFYDVIDAVWAEVLLLANQTMTSRAAT